MSTPKPGQIRCPTCHRSTAPAAFCTHCGSAIPASAVTRPRGMDRDELDARVRRRGGDPAYRRGGYADEWGAAGAAGYERFEPEEEDALAHREPEHAQARVDQVSDGPEAVEWPRNDIDEPPHHEAGPDEPVLPPTGPTSDPWRRGREVSDAPAAAGGSLVPPLPPLNASPAPATGYDPAASSQPDPWAARAADAPAPLEASEDVPDDEGWPADEPYYIPARDDDRGGNSALPIIGFVALGVVALLMGVFFSNLFGGDEPAARITPTPVATASSTPPSETPQPTTSTEASTSGQPNASDGPPIVFPDGFVATTEPCASQPNGAGCDADGAVNDGSIWIYIAFEKGRGDDVVGMTIVDEAGSVVVQASLELSELGGPCAEGGPCNGWMLFPGFGTPYTGLEAGDYTIRINRNGLPAAEADFTVA